MVQSADSIVSYKNVRKSSTWILQPVYNTCELANTCQVLKTLMNYCKYPIRYSLSDYFFFILKNTQSCELVYKIYSLLPHLLVAFLLYMDGLLHTYTPDHLLLDSDPNLGPLISSWELIGKFKNCWNKSFWKSKILTVLYQQFSNLLISQRDMSGPRLGALSNNRWSVGSIYSF